MPKLFDVHAHLQFPDFDRDRDEVIKRALDENIYFINVGIDKKSSQESVELADRYPVGIWATVGQHPSDLKNFDYKFFKNLAQHPKVVAIGECGLDYARIQNSESRIKNTQKEIFIQQIKLAKEFGKPLMIHCRDAHKDLLEILKENRNLLIPKRAGIMHFFGGNGAWENVDEYLDLGFYISFSGVITFPKYSHFEDIGRLPSDRILIETDAPFVGPEPYRGQRNEPFYIIETAKKLAEIKRVFLEEVSTKTTENAMVVFGLKI